MNKADKLEFVKETLRINGFKITAESVSIGILLSESIELKNLKSFLDEKGKEFDEFIEDNKEITHMLMRKYKVDVEKPLINLSTNTEFSKYADFVNKECSEYIKELHLAMDSVINDAKRCVAKPNEYYLTTYLEDVRSFWNGNQWQNKPVDCPSYLKEKAIEYSDVLNCSIINVKSFE